MQRSNLFQTLFILLFAVVFLSACSKSGSNPAPQNTMPAPTITSLSNTEGDYNATIIITGTNFSSAVADNQVFFNGKAATVTAATATQLTVTVPQDAGNGNVTVKVGANTASGPTFTYLGVLAISSLNVNHGPCTTSVIIQGTGFSPVSAKNQIFFNGKAATITAATSTQLTTTVPLSAGTGNISVSVDNGSQLPGPVFTYELSYVSILLAGNNQNGVVNGLGSAATLDSPNGIAIDNTGNMYLPESTSQLVRKITPQGLVSSYAGLASSSVNNGTVAPLSLRYPTAVAVDASGNLYIADGQLNWIQKITPTGVVTVLAGTGAPGANNGLGNAASFQYPAGLAVDALGNVYVADSDNNLIRKITPQGVVSTLAGSGSEGSSDGTGTAASFYRPIGIAVDTKGNLYVTDNNNYSVRKITPDGVVTTLAKNAFNISTGIVADAAGNVYIVNVTGSVAQGQIDKITPDGKESIIAIDLGATLTGLVLDKNNNIFYINGNSLFELAYE